MEAAKLFLEWLEKALETKLFDLGETTVTIRTIVHIVLLAILLYYFSGKLRTWISERYLAKRKADVGVRKAIASLVRYSVLVVGFVVILQTAGIDLSSMVLLGGALGIGIGFGLQQIANDFFSGLILLIERPIKVGDRVEVGQTIGDVVNIGLRATTIVTNDNIAMIVPNSQFTSNSVTNWTHSARDVRFHIPVGVSYSSDPELVRTLLVEVASQHPGVLQNPGPDVIFLGYGESSLDFELRAWTDTYITRPLIFRSDMYFAIWNKLKEHGIEIPFPQRDLHIRSGLERIGS